MSRKSKRGYNRLYIIPPEQRSYTMSRIRSKNTKSVMLACRYVHTLVFRHRLHSSNLLGHSSIVLSKWHTFIFVNRCLRHHHVSCKTAIMAKSNGKTGMPIFSGMWRRTGKSMWFGGGGLACDHDLGMRAKD